MAIDAREAQDLLAAGSLRPGQAITLLTPLRNAERSLAAGRSGLACFHVFQFQVAVTRLILFRALTLQRGIPLIDSATALRTALGC